MQMWHCEKYTNSKSNRSSTDRV